MFSMQQHNLCFLCGEWASAPGVDRCTSCRFLCAAARPGLLRLLQILAVHEFEAGCCYGRSIGVMHTPLACCVLPSAVNLCVPAVALRNVIWRSSIDRTTILRPA